MHPLIDKLLQGRALMRDESQMLFASLVRGKLSDVEIAELLVALKTKGETSDEIAGAAAALLQAAQPFPRPDYKFADVVGTGGDGASTINISTAVAFVSAAAGLPVAKHGNRAVSSKCGAADLLERFGFHLEQSPAQARLCLDETGFSFLFAPHYHSGIRHAMPVRKQLGTRTLFNILGPLVNPARPPIMLLGVYDSALCQPVAEALQLLGCERALVVHGQGLDEFALHGETVAAELNGDVISSRKFSPSDFGAREYPLSSIVGGNAEQNARAISALLAGSGHAAHTAAVAINAAALFWIAGVANSLVHGFELAHSILADGSALRLMERAAAISRSGL